MSKNQRTTSGANFFTRSDRIVNTAEAYNIFNQLQTAEYTPIFNRQPEPGFSGLRDRIAGPGTVATVAGETRLTATGGTAGIYTRDYGRYVPGLVGLPGLRTRLESNAGVIYRYGYGDDNGNRMGLEYRVDSDAWFSFVESGGVRWYEQPRANWIDPLDGTGPSGVNANLNGATLRLPFGWYGGLSCLFEISVSDRFGGDRTMLADSSGGRTGGVLVEQPNLPIFIEATDGGVIYRGGAHYGVYGRYRPQYRITSTPVQTTTGLGATLRPIVSLRVKNALRWRGVPVILTGESVIADNDSRYVIIIDGTLDSANFGPLDGIDPDETAVEINTDATTVTGGYRTATSIVAAGAGNASGASRIDPPDLPIPAGAVVTLAVAAFSGTSTTARGVLRVREEW